MLKSNEFRYDFPIFKKHEDLIYFDSAASTQKPKQVIERITRFYESEYAPVHRGIYTLAESATQHYEDARKTVAQFINADWDEITFTKNATEGINFIASTWANEHLKVGQEILLTELEHHANLIPWQQLAKRKNVKLRFIPVNYQGQLEYDQLPFLINKNTALVAITQCSNAIGTHVDVQKIIKIARTIGAKILIDAAQSAPHQKIDVKKMDCDFLVFSAHKMLGPTGIGALYISKKIEPVVVPYQFGGGMIYEASFDTAVWRKPPYCYEAGTQPVAQAIGFAAAIDYLNRIDFKELATVEAGLCKQLIDGLKMMPSITIIGPEDQLRREGHLVSFMHKKYHAHDVAAFLDKQDICVRSGHYCAQPLAKKLGIESSVRVSFYLYNTEHEVTRLLDALSTM